MNKLARSAGSETDVNFKFAVLKGFRPTIRRDVLLQNPTDLQGVLNAAKRAEQAYSETDTDNLASSLLRIEQQMQKLAVATNEAKQDCHGAPAATYRSATVVRSRSPSPYTSDHWNSSDRPKVRFQEPYANQGAMPRQQNIDSGYKRQFQPRAGSQWSSAFQQPGQRFRTPAGSCGNCGRRHNYGECRASGVTCYNCNKLHHLARCCRSVKAAQNTNQSA